MLNKCLQCGIEFESKRAGAKFHSDSCRKKYGRTSFSQPQEIVKTPKVIKSVEDLKKVKIKETKSRFPQAIRLNKNMAERMTFGGSVNPSTNRIEYTLPDGTKDSMKYTD